MYIFDDRIFQSLQVKNGPPPQKKEKKETEDQHCAA
jgi:hypothetical protein